MRYVKVFMLILIFFIAMLFFFQNTEALSQTLSLKLDFIIVPGLKFYSIPLPLYFLVLLAFLVGSMFSLLYFLMDKLRVNKLLKASSTKLASLEQELNSLRNMPLDNSMSSSDDANTEEAAL